MNSIEKLIQIFSQFPGIGPRQARRFVYFMLTRGDSTLLELSKHIADLKSNISVCCDCHRFFEKRHDKAIYCNICSNPERDHSTLMLIQRDADLESVEKNGGFKGTYFVLGGAVPILEKEPEKRIRINELRIMLEKKGDVLKEVILAMNWNPEGENTAEYVQTEIKRLVGNKIKISKLGKGLSMGTELEYADSDTLKNALRNRS